MPIRVNSKPATFTELKGEFVLYNGQPEIKLPEIGEISKGGTVPAPVEMTAEEIDENCVNAYVVMKNVKVEGTANDETFKNPYTITDAKGNTVKMWNFFYNAKYCDVVDVLVGEDIIVTGFVGRDLYGDATEPTYQIDCIKVEKNTQSGIAEIETADENAVYFDLRGVRVENPANGIMIEVKEGSARKVMLR